jgi:hypothetical protein
MSIAGVKEKCKALAAAIPRDVLVVATLIFASSVSFGLGYLTGRDPAAGEGSAISMEATPSLAAHQAPIVETTSTTTPTSPQPGPYLASKNGTKYYLPTCSGAKRISETNKVWFPSAAAAAAAGYTPAANCPGL